MKKILLCLSSLTFISLFSSCNFFFGNTIIPTKKTLETGTYISEETTCCTGYSNKYIDGTFTTESIDTEKHVQILIVKPNREIHYEEMYCLYYDSEPMMEGYSDLKNYITLDEPKIISQSYKTDGTYEIGLQNKITFDFPDYPHYHDPLQNGAIWEYTWTKSSNTLKFHKHAILDGGLLETFTKISNNYEQ